MVGGEFQCSMYNTNNRYHTPYLNGAAKNETLLLIDDGLEVGVLRLQVGIARSKVISGMEG